VFDTSLFDNYSYLNLNNSIVFNNSEFYENINQDLYQKGAHNNLLEKDSSYRFSIGKSTDRCSMTTNDNTNVLSKKTTKNSNFLKFSISKK